MPSVRKLTSNLESNSSSYTPSRNMFISRTRYQAARFFWASGESSCTIPLMENANENRDIPNMQVSEPLDDAASKPTETRRERVRRACRVDEERRPDLHASLNHRISHLCKMAALVIAVVTFGSTVLGQDNSHFVVLGLSLSVALLAIALLQDSSHHKH